MVKGWGHPITGLVSAGFLLGFCWVSGSAVNTCHTEMGGQVRAVQIIPERDLYRLVIMRGALMSDYRVSIRGGNRAGGGWA